MVRGGACKRRWRTYFVHQGLNTKLLTVFCAALVGVKTLERCYLTLVKRLPSPIATNVRAHRWTKLGELESEVGRTEALYAAVTEEARVAEQEGVSLTTLRTRLEREMVQLGNETVRARHNGIP